MEPVDNSSHVVVSALGVCYHRPRSTCLDSYLHVADTVRLSSPFLCASLDWPRHVIWRGSLSPHACAACPVYRSGFPHAWQSERLFPQSASGGTKQTPSCNRRFP